MTEASRENNLTISQTVPERWQRDFPPESMVRVFRPLMSGFA
jgi:hypothetical protein